MDFFTANIGWLLFAYVLGTMIGYWWGIKANVMNVSETIIDSLIEQKFIKARGTGENMELIPWTDWGNDQTTDKTPS